MKLKLKNFNSILFSIIYTKTNSKFSFLIQLKTWTAEGEDKFEFFFHLSFYTTLTLN